MEKLADIWYNSLTRNETMAEDLLQEVFYKALLHIDRFEGRCSLYTWLYQIGKNAWLKECRKHKCVGGNTFSGETYYRLSFSLEFEGMKTKMEVEVTNGGVLSYSTSTEVPELNLLSMWSEYLWQDYRGCYFDPELGEYVYYDETN